MENTLVTIDDPRKYPVVQLPSPVQFEAYARAANSMPLLSDNAERTLIASWIQNQDREAARQLVVSHLRLVVKSARAHAGYGLPAGDLAQEGTVGLMKAVHRFRPEMGVRLAAFASRWIEAEIREFIFRSWRLVRLGSGAAMRKLFFGYRRTLSSLRKMDPDRVAGVTQAEIARAMGVTEDQVAIASSYFRGQDMSLSPPDSDDEGMDTHRVEYQASMASDDYSPEDHTMDTIDNGLARRAMREGWAKLSSREQRVLSARRLADPPVGLKELGLELSISAERVRQVEQSAWAKLVRLSQEALEPVAA